MKQTLDFFQCLEDNLEPYFNDEDYSRIPEDVRTQLEKNKLFRISYLSEITCRRCNAECPEYNYLDMHYDEFLMECYYICPSGFLKNPVWVKLEEAKVRQFNFTRIFDLIRDNSNFESLRFVLLMSDELNRELGYGRFNQKDVAIIYRLGLRLDNFIARLAELRVIVPLDILVIITPVFEPVKPDDELRLKANNTVLINFRNLMERNFNITKLIEDKGLK